MTQKLSISILFILLITFVSCSGQDNPNEQAETTNDEQTKSTTVEQEPHRYGGWYCPDNFGFVPVDIQKLDEVPAISHRLPTEEELQNNMSLINVDTEKYPDARALDMDLPKVARIYTRHNGLSELIIVIQAIVVQEDTVVGYRFANGGNGSARLNEVEFLSDEEINEMGSQPFFYSTAVVSASKDEIWSAFIKTKYADELGEKFDEKVFFSSNWIPGAEAFLEYSSERESAKGYVGVVFGNLYLQIDYDKDGHHYSEKLLMIENNEDNNTELFFASGPFPNDFEGQKANWDNWFKNVVEASIAK